ncbi:MAG: DUF6691 family protein [Litorivicinus sp.]
MTGLIGLIMGALFGAGLVIAGMTNPAKGAGIPVAFLGHWWLARRGNTLTGQPWTEFMQGALDRPLILGSVLFGAGWGLGGFCPGPGLASLLLQPAEAGLFVVSMLAAMWAHDRVGAR